MPAAEMRGRDPGSLELVVGTFAKTDGRRYEPVAKRFGHVRNHEPGVDASAEKRAERHFAFEPISYCLTERDTHVFDQRVRVPVIGIEFRDVPVLACDELSARGKQPMTRLQLVDVLEHRRGRE